LSLDQYFPGEDQRLSALAGGSQPSLHKYLVKPFFAFRRHGCFRNERAADPETARSARYSAAAMQSALNAVQGVEVMFAEEVSAVLSEFYTEFCTTVLKSL
jgi:hypothetical protein